MTKRIETGESLEEVLESLFAEMHLEITESETPRFACDCSRKKIESALISMGRDELTDIIEKDGRAELVCRFCNKKYQFDEDELRALLAEAVEKQPEDVPDE